MKTINEVKEFLLGELKEERSKMLMKEENDYSYLFMLCNDMGFIEEEDELLTVEFTKGEWVDIKEYLEMVESRYLDIATDCERYYDEDFIIRYGKASKKAADRVRVLIDRLERALA